PGFSKARQGWVRFAFDNARSLFRNSWLCGYHLRKRSGFEACLLWRYRGRQNDRWGFQNDFAVHGQPHRPVTLASNYEATREICRAVLPGPPDECEREELQDFYWRADVGRYLL